MPEIKYPGTNRQSGNLLAKLESRIDNAVQNHQGILRILVAALLLLQLGQFFAQKFLQQFRSIFASVDASESMFNLLFFDVLILIAGAMFLVFILSVFSGTPQKPARFLKKFSGRPVITFLFFAVLLETLLVFLPTVIADRFAWVYDSSPSVFPHRAYIAQVSIVAVCVALSLADIVSKTNRSRLWLAPFLLLPFGLFNSFPLLFWNAAQRWAPFGLWKIFRPVCAAATCIMPILIFPTAQPIRPVDFTYGMGDRGFMLSEGKPGRSFLPENRSECIAYQAVYSSAENSLYMRCDSSLVRFIHSDPEKWEFDKEVPLDFKWDQGSFDFEKKTAYIADAISGNITVVNLSDLSIIAKIAISGWKTSDHAHQVKQAYDSTSKQLVVATINGILYLVDTTSRQVTAKTTLPSSEERSLVWDLRIIQARNELLALQPFRLSALKMDDLSFVREIKFDSPAHGLLPDEKRNRLLVAFPAQMKIESFSIDKFSSSGSRDAPAGTRAMAIDNQNGVILLSSISGVVEVRRIKDLSRIARVRLVPWIHWVEPIPQMGACIITAAGVQPVLWQYSPAQTTWSFSDFFLQKTESAIKLVIDSGIKPAENLN